MGADIKNGKLNTFNIYAVKLLLLLILPFSNPAAGDNVKKEGKWIIVIDPGHGGRDPGALGKISREKDINLAVALKTGRYIRENIRNAVVVYTRDGDTTVDLYERPKIANANNADLFISIHTNWAKSGNISGAETYIMGNSKDQANLEVAMKENEVILLEDDYSTKYEGFDPKSPESYIMFSLMQNVFQKQSTDLASRVQTQFSERVDRNDRGVKQAGFWVLFNTTMPSILIELGFITNDAEERYLNGQQGQDYMASAIFRACRDYMNDIDLKSTISVQEQDTGKGKPNAESLPAGVTVFMVQVAASKTGTAVKPENFKGLGDIVEISDQNRFRYATGIFDDYADAVKYRKKLEEVYPDAFVIAVKDNKIVPLHQAIEQKRKK